MLPIPDLDITPVVKLLKSNSVDAVTITSASGVSNLFELMGKNGKLLEDVPFVVASQRIGEVCESFNVASIHVADDAGDRAMLQALSDLAAQTESQQPEDNEDLEEMQ